jgi:membrane protein implicated in regulation of membrane protease activity
VATRPAEEFVPPCSLIEDYASAVEAWEIWLIVALVLGIAEVLSLTFVLGMLSLGAGAAAVVAAVGGGPVLQVGTFVIISGALIALVVPTARRHRHTPSRLRTGTAKLIGERAMALSEINTADGGLVRIGGENWTARPYSDGVVIPAGEWVEVMQIDGATAVVHPTTLPVSGS